MSEDYGDWVQNNEGDLLGRFLEENDTDWELLYAGIEYATKHPCKDWTVEQVLEAVVVSKKEWRRRFDAFCEDAWDSYRTSGPEPERD